MSFLCFGDLLIVLTALSMHVKERYIVRRQGERKQRENFPFGDEADYQYLTCTLTENANTH